MTRIFLSCLAIALISCNAQTQSTNSPQSDVEIYATQHPDNTEPSVSHGTVGNGTLENGKLMPFSGPNFMYFDALSYTNGRAYTNGAVKAAILGAYKRLETEVPGRQFGLMECSQEHGGKIMGHRTHQNGLGVDFMMPKIKHNKPYYKLDSTGAAHYFLEFDNHGRYLRDPEISIDFDLVARHILALDSEARTHGHKVAKVIIKIELKDELFATEQGKLLKESGIYVVRGLTPAVNAMHDEHYHIDFAPL